MVPKALICVCMSVSSLCPAILWAIQIRVFVWRISTISPYGPSDGCCLAELGKLSVDGLKCDGKLWRLSLLSLIQYLICYISHWQVFFCSVWCRLCSLSCSKRCCGCSTEKNDADIFRCWEMAGKYLVGKLSQRKKRTKDELYEKNEKHCNERKDQSLFSGCGTQQESYAKEKQFLIIHLKQVIRNLGI